MKNLKATAPLPLILLALSKCSGEAQGGPGEVSSGISSSKALSAVTTQEAARGCAHMKDAVSAHFNRSSARSGLCTLLGLALSTDEPSCTRQRDACLNGESGDATVSDPAQEFECSDASVDGWQGCAATVGDMEACLNDMLAAFDTLLSSSTCKDAGQPQPTYTEDCTPPPIDPVTGLVAIDPVTGLPYVDRRSECEAANASGRNPPTPPSCQTLQTKCPQLELFGSRSDDEPTSSACATRDADGSLQEFCDSVVTGTGSQLIAAQETRVDDLLDGLCSLNADDVRFQALCNPPVGGQPWVIRAEGNWRCTFGVRSPAANDPTSGGLCAD